MLFALQSDFAIVSNELQDQIYEIASLDQTGLNETSLRQVEILQRQAQDFEIFRESFQLYNKERQQGNILSNRLEENQKQKLEEQAQIRNVILDTLDAEIRTQQQLLNIEERRYQTIGNLERSVEARQDILRGQQVQELIEIEKLHNKKLITDNDYEQAKQDIEKYYRNEKIKAEVEAYTTIFRAGQEQAEAFYQVSANQQQAILNERKTSIQESFTAENKALTEAKEAGLITESAYEQQLEILQKDKEKQEKKLEYNQAVREKKAAQSQAAIETAINIIESFPNPLNMALAASTGLAQAAIINSQPLPQMERGGLLSGKRHNTGGIHIEAEDGEIILNRNVSKNPFLLQMASMMNESTGGKRLTNLDYAGAKQMNNMSDSIDLKKIVKEVVDGVVSIPVKNVATDTEKTARRVKNLATRSKL